MTTIVNKYQDDMDAVNDWCDEIYNEKFASFFDKVRQLYNKFQDREKPITDTELEDIMTNLPLELFSVSENLNNLRASCEVVKLKRKEKRITAVRNSAGKNDTARNQDADMEVLEDDILLLGFSTIIQRVENEISFCRELIMGCKKVYDRRRSTENVHPVGVSDIPEYTPAIPSSSTGDPSSAPNYTGTGKSSIPGTYIK